MPRHAVVKIYNGFLNTSRGTPHSVKTGQLYRELYVKRYVLITKLMHLVLFVYKILFLYTFRAINVHLQEDTLYTCSIGYCHSLRELVVASRYTALVESDSTICCMYTTVS